MLALYLLIFGCRSNVKLIEWNEEALQKSQQEDEVDTIVKLKTQQIQLKSFRGESTCLCCTGTRTSSFIKTFILSFVKAATLVTQSLYFVRAPVFHQLSRRFVVCKGCNNSHAIVSLSHATSCSRRKKVPQEVFKTSSLSGCRWRNSRLCLENAPKGEIQTRQLARRLNRRRWAKTCGGKTAVTGFSLKTSKFLKMLILFFFS